ncbi:MAG: alanyl-tRNA editing protein [Acidimicrobiia bacterium]|nr:alanyl-tRNA editing protein [Actinomycetota bacterium]MBL6924114.1 alanyl-tRNA editing protein [Acidimicrobiia bacterium]MBL6925899.1 alanyl-tRNA editing protein [Acidimicrobiia bacterium]
MWPSHPLGPCHHLGHQQREQPVTDRLYLRDADLRSFEATVVSVHDDRVELDRTAFYATSGGQPHDTGHITWDTGAASVVDVRSDGARVLHHLAGPVPAVGTVITGEVDNERRHQLMRTHTAMHVLCGVIWREWHRPVTGGNMEPLQARMDFELTELPEDFKERVEQLCNAEVAADRPIEVSFLARGEALSDDDLIRTKVNLIPESVTQIRVVDIVGLDRQADGGTHVSSTGQVGRLEVVKTESKGKGFKRVRIRLHDA